MLQRVLTRLGDDPTAAQFCRVTNTPRHESALCAAPPVRRQCAADAQPAHIVFHEQCTAGHRRLPVERQVVRPAGLADTGSHPGLHDRRHPERRAAYLSECGRVRLVDALDPQIGLDDDIGRCRPIDLGPVVAERQATDVKPGR